MLLPHALEMRAEVQSKEMLTARLSDLSGLKSLPDSRDLPKRTREFESRPLRH